MAKYKLEDGRELELFTQEELDAKTEEAKQSLQPEIDRLTQELTTAKDIAENQKTAKTGAEKQIEDLQKQIAELTSTVQGNTREELLGKLSNGDADVRAKIEHEYKQFGGDPVDKATIEERMFKAYKLAVPEAQPNTLAEAVQFASTRGAVAPATEGSDPNKIAEMGKNFGITKEDADKYLPQINQETKVTQNG